MATAQRQRPDRLQRLTRATDQLQRRVVESVPPWYQPARAYKGADIPSVPVGPTFDAFAALMDASSLLVYDYFRHDRRQQDARTTAFLSRTPWSRLDEVGARVHSVVREAEDAAAASKRRAPREQFDFEVPPGDFDIIITDRRTGAQQVERIRVGQNESVALDISPEA